MYPPVGIFKKAFCDEMNFSEKEIEMMLQKN
jgi:hypothetical protein